MSLGAAGVGQVQWHLGPSPVADTQWGQNYLVGHIRGCPAAGSLCKTFDLRPRFPVSANLNLMFAATQTAVLAGTV